MAEKYSLEYLKKLTEPYTRRIDFKNNHPKEYAAALKRGILDEICSHMPGKKVDTLEELIEKAKPYSRRVDFLKGDRSAYMSAQRHGWIDIVCKDMPTKYKRKKSTNESYSYADLERIASGYETRKEFQEGNPNAYAIAVKRGIMDKICQHMKVLQNFYTIDECYEEAAKYSYRKAFEKGSPKHYDYARRHGWLDDVCHGMIPKRQSWPKQKCIEVASELGSLKEFRELFASAYNKCWKNGWLDEVTGHLQPGRISRTLEECKEIASQYNYRSDFKEAHFAVYGYCQQHGWLDEVCKDMDRVGNVYWRMLYVYEFKDGSAYVGLTCNYTRRKWQHLNEEADAVYRHIASGHTEYDLIELSDYIPKDEAARLEDEYINKYRDAGWKMLNTRKGGGLGYARRNHKKKDGQ